MVIMRCTPLMGGLVYNCEVRYPLQVRQTSVPVTLQLMQSDAAAMLPRVLHSVSLTPANVRGAETYKRIVKQVSKSAVVLVKVHRPVRSLT